MAVKQLFLVGDSLTAGKLGGHDFAQGGDGSWAEHTRGLLGNIDGLGPLISSGIRLTETAVNGLSLGEWTGGGTWTDVASTDAFDKYPYGHGGYATGSSFTRTYTVPAWMPPIVGFQLYWIDMNGGGHSGGNWSYKINSGSQTAMGQTLALDNSLNVFYVSTALSAGDTVQIRAANTAGTSVYCLPVGIELFFLPPSTTQGLIVHNMSIGGGKLNTLVAATSGDRMAFVDSVKAGTGSPKVPDPDALVMGIINDVQLGNVTTWANDIATFYSRTHNLGTLGYYSAYEANFGTYPQSTQTSYRAQTKSSAASHGIPVLDWYDKLAAYGVTGNAATSAAGFLEADLIHPSQAGHNYLSPLCYWFIRNNVLGLGTVSEAYTATAKKADVQYSAKKASVPYLAGAPVAIIERYS